MCVSGAHKRRVSRSAQSVAYTKKNHIFDFFFLNHSEGIKNFSSYTNQVTTKGIYVCEISENFPHSSHYRLW